MLAPSWRLVTYLTAVARFTTKCKAYERKGVRWGHLGRAIRRENCIIVPHFNSLESWRQETGDSGPNPHSVLGSGNLNLSKGEFRITDRCNRLTGPRVIILRWSINSCTTHQLNLIQQGAGVTHPIFPLFRVCRVLLFFIKVAAHSHVRLAACWSGLDSYTPKGMLLRSSRWYAILTEFLSEFLQRLGNMPRLTCGRFAVRWQICK